MSVWAFQVRIPMRRYQARGLKSLPLDLPDLGQRLGTLTPCLNFGCLAISLLRCSSSRSLLNHSCDPCADALVTGRRGVELRAKRRVRRGEEITISYSGHYSREDREARRAALQEGWDFECG